MEIQLNQSAQRMFRRMKQAALKNVLLIFGKPKKFETLFLWKAAFLGGSF